jgi:ankyrin repeat protein
MSHHHHEHDENCDHDHDHDHDHHHHEHDENCNHDHHGHHHHEHDENCDHDHDQDHGHHHEHGESCNHDHHGHHHHKAPKRNVNIPKGITPQDHQHNSFEEYLQCAITRNAEEEVKQLLAHCGGDITEYLNNTRFADHSHPLSMACAAGSLRIAQYFLDQGVNVEKVDASDDSIASCLFFSCYTMNPNADVVRLIYQQNPSVINTSHKRVKFTPLMAASQRADLKTISFLMEKGAEVNCDGAHGLTPLMLSLDLMSDPHRDKTGHLQAAVVAMHLIKCGAKVEYETSTGLTALWRACMKRQGDQIKLLLLAGADANRVCYDMSCIYAVVVSEDEKPHQCGGHHHHVIPQTPREECIRYLLEANSRPDYKVNLDTLDMKGTQTPLKKAVESNMKNVAVVLIESGANPKQQVEGKTAYELIMEGGDQDLKSCVKKAEGCAVCKKKESLMRCSRCHSVWYCGRGCQTQDWNEHKVVCVKK